MAKIKGLIAEIGNHHFGDVNKAKELIKAAYEHGAHFVKMQMIEASEVVKYGSMPLEFYQQCQLTLEQYQECYEYAESLGAELFFSYFGEKLPQIGRLRKWSANQTCDIGLGSDPCFQHENNIFSLPLELIVAAYKQSENVPATIMVASDYLQDAKKVAVFLNKTLKEIPLRDFGDLGYSDHTIGVRTARDFARNGIVETIEKHFNIYGIQKWNGIPYRDCFHAANCQELESLAKTMRGIQ